MNTEELNLYPKISDEQKLFLQKQTGIDERVKERMELLKLKPPCRNSGLLVFV